MWEKLSDDGTVHDRDNLYTWANAFAVHVATLNFTSFAGHNDWRLPNVRELQSIANYQNVNPAMSAAFNTNCAPGCHATTCSCTVPGNYWSSTSSVSSPYEAWYVGFFYGSVDAFGVSGGKSAAAYVRAVRDATASSTTTTTSTTTTSTRPSTTSTTTPGSGTCSAPIVIPAGGGTFSGTTSGSSALAGTCGSTGGAPERVYQWTPSVSGTATIQTCGAATNFDTVLYIRNSPCPTGTELPGGCNDDACTNSSGLFRAPASRRR